MRAAAGAVLLVAAATAAAQTVAVGGTMGQRAMLVVDGRARTVAVGETVDGIRLVRIEGDAVVVEHGGRQASLRVGGAPARLAGTAPVAAAGRTIVIPVGPGGHFVATGAINGRAVQFMVDTGATMVALGQADAERIGIDWRGGERTLVGTANGSTVAHRVTLSSLRVGGVEVANVGALVVPAPMPMVLLGNSFLSRFSMQRDADVLRLEAR